MHAGFTSPAEHDDSHGGEKVIKWKAMESNGCLQKEGLLLGMHYTLYVSK